MTSAEVGRQPDGVSWLLSALRWQRADVGDGFLVLPTSSAPRVVVGPVGAGSLAAPLRTFQRLRPLRTRLVRSVLAAAVTADRGRRLGAVVPVAGAGALLDELRRCVGTPEIVVFIGLPTAGPNRKPVLQVHDRDGRPLAFAKVGWSAATRDRVRNEARALETLATAREVRVPRLLHAGSVGELEIVVTAPLPAGARRASGSPPLDAVRAVIAGGNTSSSTIDGAPAVEALRGRAERLPTSPVADRLRGLLDVVLAVDRGCEVAFGGCHGDWVPWNMATSKGKLHVFDWEHWDPEGPVGSDLLHHDVHVSVFSRGQALVTALEDAEASSADLLGALGVRGRSASAVRRLYLAHLATRTLEATAAGAPDTGPIASGLATALEAAVSNAGRRA